MHVGIMHSFLRLWSRQASNKDRAAEHGDVVIVPSTVALPRLLLKTAMSKAGNGKYNNFFF
jgi:hypothetical protein